ncbi:MAG: FliM/FliN family flagellar motor switch protein [Planctomycetaceae bacterium]|nr:FliM/FliN family flagellar motor switch protein [Planctomycetaceae bacterium]
MNDPQTNTHDTTSSGTSAATSRVSTRPVEFPAAGESSAAVGQLPLNRFYDMSVLVTVELGRVEVPIGELLRLGEGSVIEFERAVDEPVEVFAQGVPLARGDVVTVNGRYAVRVTQIIRDANHA